MERDFLIEAYDHACCGCGACAAKCPVSCIKMMVNKEGFYRAVVDKVRCIDCGQCKSVCPMIREASGETAHQMEAFAAYSRNETVRRNASSGGIFLHIAEWILEKGGVVYGAAFDEAMQLKHIRVEKREDLLPLCGSKYLQSNLDEVYKTVQDSLAAGKYVFFVGTPCQVAALYAFIGERSEKLVTADVICHGTPSSGLFMGYLHFLERKHKGEITGYQFRCKENGNDRMSYTTRITVQSADKERTVYLNGDEEPYTLRFLSNALQNECCYECPFANMERMGDITLGDYWGYEQVHPELSEVIGVSLVLVNSKKGQAILGELKDIALISTREEDFLKRNTHLRAPPEKHIERDLIYHAFSKGGFTSKFYSRYFLPRGYTMYILKRRIRSWLKWERN